MKKISKHGYALVICLFFTGLACRAQDATEAGKKEMKTYVIERNIPGAGQFTAAKLKDISKTSCTVLRELGPGIQWIQSYVTDNKIFCIYKAESIELLKEHATKGGFPITAVYEVENVISPATAGN
jgi:hypothetical protein